MDQTRVWTIPGWCKDAGLSRGWWYAQPEERRPRHGKAGKSVRVYETPAQYFERIARERQTEQAAA